MVPEPGGAEALEEGGHAQPGDLTPLSPKHCVDLIQIDEHTEAVLVSGELAFGDAALE